MNVYLCHIRDPDPCLCTHHGRNDNHGLRAVVPQLTMEYWKMTREVAQVYAARVLL